MRIRGKSIALNTMPKLRRNRLARLWQAYLGWRWQKAASTSLAIFSIITISLMTYSAFAATTTRVMVPDGDVTASGWTASPSGSLYTTVDEGSTSDTADYITTAGSSADNETAQFSLDRVEDVLSASQMVVTIYARNTAIGGGTADTLAFGLVVNGTPLTAATCTPAAGWSACTTTYSAAWTWAAVDSMEIKVQRIVQGGGNPSSRADTIEVANVYGTLTYTPSIMNTQSAYRWFENQVPQAASDQTTFANAYGEADDEGINDVIQTSDGGYAIAGEFTWDTTNGYTDVAVSKYDASGNLSWVGDTLEMGQLPTVDATANSIAQTNDGGYIVAGGNYNSVNGNTNAFIIKYSSSGSAEWISWYQGGGSNYLTLGQDVVQTSDGGYALTGKYNDLAGSSGYDMFLVKYDSSGTIIWGKTWGSSVD
ncbi:MAG TPA: hypothetical protein VFK03_03845, partial [Candidatus Saccharimonadales bacterium]|nr:hypothetical protein [Candidatus Saccharimonadales bacterium]